MANQKFNLTFDINANIAPIKSAISQLQSSFSSLKLPDGIGKDFEKTLGKLNAEMSNFEAIAAKGFTSMADISKAEKSFDKITSLLQQTKNQLGKIKGIDPEKLLPKATLDKISKLGDLWKSAEKALNNTDSTKAIKALDKKLKDAEKSVGDLKAKIDGLNASNKSKGSELGGIESHLRGAKKDAEELQQKLSSLEASGVSKTSAEYKQLSKDLKDVNIDITEQIKRQRELKKEIADNKAEIEKISPAYKQAKINVRDYGEELTKLQNTVKDPEELTVLREELAKIKNVDISQIPTDINKLNNEINNLTDEELKEINSILTTMGGNFESAAVGAEKCGEAIRGTAAEGEKLNAAAQEVENLTRRFTNFFQITNGVLLFRRALKSAISTIKELDKVMTETAVVTDFTVGDMWDQLPDYTKRAKELGVATKEVYEASTLYYQQGLNSQQVTELTVPTLKMARIASLDAADATDRMTNALRGFNMELNQTSAERVADVYSKLAAITASNVDEISTAMTKTASIASSAGMAFETTAAFLSQIIETTRESAETAGTALKTVIARFEELKKSPSEIGEVDGEIVDANKIETALRSVGVALRDEEGQFRNLDDVFLELAQKWNTLDKNTQRYIATIAAGSRQQSRFIAMMQNYDHTIELVGAAYNSAGASERQYEKTQESLQNKLARLKNTWDEFAMGLSNSKIVKGAVDLLTKLLEILNKTTTASNSAVTSISKLATTIGIFAGGKVLVKKFSKFIIADLLGQNWTDVGNTIGSNIMGAINKRAISSANYVNILANSFKMAEGELAEFNYLTLAGVDADLAAIAAKKGLTLEVTYEAAAKRVGKKTTDDLTAADLNLYLTEQLGNGTIAQRIKLLTTKIGVDIKSIAVSLGLADAETAVWLATLKLAAAVTLVIAVVWGLIKCIQAAKAASPEGKLDSAKEKLEETSIAASEAADSFNNLSASFDNLSSKQEELSNLTKGTQEWNDKVQEVNESVLELIDNYPELAKYVTRDNNGILNIDAEDSRIQEIYTQYENNKIKAAMAELAAKAGVESAQNVVDYAELSRNTRLHRVAQYNYGERDMKGTTVLSDQSDTELIAKALAKGELTLKDGTIVSDGDLLNDYLEEKGYDTYFEGTKEEFEALRKFGEALNKTSDLLDTYSLSLANTAFLQVDNTNISGRQKEALASIYTSDMVNAIIEAEKSKENITDEEAYQNALDIIINNLEKMATFLQKQDNPVVDALSKENGENLTREGLNTLNRDYLSTYYYQNQDVLKDIYATAGDFIDAINKRVNIAIENFTTSDEVFEKFGFKQNANLTSGAAKGLSDNLMLIYKTSGENAAKTLANQFNNILLDTTADTQEELITRLNALDWTSIEDLNTVKSIFKELGINIPDEQLEILVADMKDFAKAISRISFENLMTQLDDLATRKTNVQKQIDEGTNNFTLEEVQKYIEEGIDGSKFTMTEDGFVYDGGLEELLNHIDTQVTQQVDDNKNTYEPGSFEERTLQNRKLSQLNGQELLLSDNKYADDQLEAQIKSNEKYRNEIDIITKSLKKQNSQLTENEKLIKANAKDVTDQQEKLKTLTEQVKEYNEAIENGDKLAQQTAETKITESLKEIFNDKEGFIDENFIAENKANITKLTSNDIKVVENAYAAIQKSYADKVKEQSATYADFLNNVEGGVDELSQIELDLKLYGTADFSGIVGKIAETYKYGSAKFTEMIQMLQQITGATIDFSFETKTLSAKAAERQWDKLNAAGWVESGMSADGKTITFKRFKNNSAIGTVTTPDVGNTTKTSGSGSSAKDISAENNFDKLYNLLEKITEESSRRNRIEKEYEFLSKSNLENVQNTAKAYRDRYESLRKELALEQELYAKRSTQLREYIDSNSQYSKYGGFKDGHVYINWDNIDALAKSVTTEEQKDYYDKMVEYIEQIKEWDDELDETNSNLLELNIQMADLRNEERDNYIDFENRVIEAIENERQTEIDNAQKISDSINKADSDLIKSIRSNIDKIRQDRENENSEEEIAKKERRLAYLRQDTTGGNKVEIQKLEEELADMKQDYGDSLVDQSLDALQDQQDAAAEQRERQIAIMESQLEWDKQNGVIAQEASDRIEAVKNANNITDTGLFAYLSTWENGDSMSAISYQKWQEGLQSAFSLAMSYKQNEDFYNAESQNLNTTGSVYYSGTKDYTRAMAEAYVNSGYKITPEIRKMNDERNAKLQANPGLKTKYGIDEITTDAKLEAWLKSTVTSLGLGSTATTSVTTAPSTQQQAGAMQKDLKVGDKVQVKSSATTFANGNKMASWVPGGSFYVCAVDGENILITTEAEYKKTSGRSYTGRVRKSDLVGYKTGGLVDFTGPAWLDGSASSPEIVLNSKDSENLIQLRNILRGTELRGGTTNGDNYFDIDVNVDEIGSDYDVSQLAEQIQSIIYKNAIYRNVNAVSLQR